MIGLVGFWEMVVVGRETGKGVGEGRGRGTEREGDAMVGQNDVHIGDTNF
jgi:hypothetical protein